MYLPLLYCKRSLPLGVSVENESSPLRKRLSVNSVQNDSVSEGLTEDVYNNQSDKRVESIDENSEPTTKKNIQPVLSMLVEYLVEHTNSFFIISPTEWKRTRWKFWHQWWVKTSPRWQCALFRRRSCLSFSTSSSHTCAKLDTVVITSQNVMSRIEIWYDNISLQGRCLRSLGNGRFVTRITFSFCPFALPGTQQHPL